jgi:hypothetical protein
VVEALNDRLKIAALAAGNNLDELVPQILRHHPEVVSVAQVFDNTTGIPQTNLHLVGSNASQSAALGAFTSTSGGNPGEPSPGRIFLDALSAQDLNAAVGDAVFCAQSATTVTENEPPVGACPQGVVVTVMTGAVVGVAQLYATV